MYIQMTGIIVPPTSGNLNVQRKHVRLYLSSKYALLTLYLHHFLQTRILCSHVLVVCKMLELLNVQKT